MEPVVATVIAVLGIAVGIFSAHATLGRQLSRGLTLIERCVADVASLQTDVKKLEQRPLHWHRRQSDPEEASDGS